METELRRALAKREMIRAARFPATMTIPPLFALALLQSLQMYLNVPSHLVDAFQRDLVTRVINGLHVLLHPENAPGIETYLRSGHCQMPDFNIEGHTSLQWFTVLSAASLGSRHLGDTAGALIVVYLANQFAATIEGDLPTMAELLRETHDGRHDKPIPERLLRDAAGGRSTHG